MAIFLFLLGCNGATNNNNSSNEDIVQSSVSDNQLDNNKSSDSNSTRKTYTLKRIPTIKESAIPKQILINNRTSKQIESKQYREIGQVSEGFSRVHEVSKFFLQKQLMMNIDLGYIDSIWDQIDSYCKDRERCAIPANKITFRYTEELYNRDSKLMKEYALKSNDNGTLQTLKDLKQNIGREIKLGAVEFIRNLNSQYQYILKTQTLTQQDTMVDMEVKWSDDNSSFFVKESNSYLDLKSKEFVADSTVTYEYNAINNTKIHKFSLYDNSLSSHNKKIEFREKEDGSYYFISDEVSQAANLTFHEEGSLFPSGGDITYSVEGYYLHETFDENGIIQSSIKCLNPNTVSNDIKEGDFCQIQDEKIIKEYLTSHIFTLGEPFTNINDITPTSAPKLHTFVKFDTNNSMVAVINCTTFRAQYKIEEYKIAFSNISKEQNGNLKCLYPYAEDSFDIMLQNGLFYGNAIDNFTIEKSHFDMAFGLWPNFDSHDRSSFDFEEFYKKHNAKEYIDSPLIDAVFHIKHTYFFSDSNYKLYRLSQDPQVIIEDNKIVIDTLDAHFEADIEVVNPTHIKFSNIKRENKENVQYPNNDSCSNREIGSNECIEDLLIDGQYNDRAFAKIIEEFLNETIEVSAASTDYKTIRFKGSNLIFEAVVAKY